MFYIQKLEIQNFLGIKSFDLDFRNPDGTHPPQMTVITGPSGSGKTSIATAAMILFSQYLKPFLGMWHQKEPEFSELMLHNGEPCALGLGIYSDALLSDGKGKIFGIAVTVSLDNSPVDYVLLNDEIENLEHLTDKYYDIWNDQECGVPLVAYYPENRTIYPPMAEGRDTSDDPLEEALYLPLANIEYFDGFFDYLRTAHRLASKIGKKQIEKGMSESDGKKLTLKRRRELVAIQKYSQILEAIDRAVCAALPEVTKIEPTKESIAVHKGSSVYTLHQLPYSEQALISLIGDIARRDAMLNPDPSKVKPLFGVVFIDDVDLWLDDSNRQSILGTLCKIFPHLQFIITATAPDVAEGHDGALVYTLK